MISMTIITVPNGKRISLWEKPNTDAQRELTTMRKHTLTDRKMTKEAWRVTRGDEEGGHFRCNPFQIDTAYGRNWVAPICGCLLYKSKPPLSHAKVFNRHKIGNHESHSPSADKVCWHWRTRWCWHATPVAHLWCKMFPGCPAQQKHLVSTRCLTMKESWTTIQCCKLVT